MSIFLICNQGVAGSNPAAGTSLPPQSRSIPCIFRNALFRMIKPMRNKAEKRGTSWHIRGTFCGTLAMVMAGLAAAPAVAQQPAPFSFTCAAVSVWDGDGPITCADGRKVRLAGVNAREVDGSCRPGHPCPRVSGIASRDALVALLGGSRGKAADGHIRVAARLRCEVTGFSYGRVTAFCRNAHETDLSCALVASGHAAIWQRHWGKHRCTR
jgi:endonuclease YncB( thermonuclease family)